MIEFQVTMTKEAALTLKYAVDQALKHWPGAPARPAAEQEQLWALRKELQAMALEIMFEEKASG